MSEPNFNYMQVPLEPYTFQQDRIKEWVERQCTGKVLNLYAGKTKLNCDKEVRNDIDEEKPADYHKPALELVKELSKKDKCFDTVVLDPPYSERKSMEKYDGNKASSFNQVKDNIVDLLNPGGKVITFGYHSISMGNTRGFEQDTVLLMSHGGAIHDTIATVEIKKQDSLDNY